MKKQQIQIQNREIAVTISKDRNDHISLTDIARFKNEKEPRDVIKNWMRSFSTIEFLGIWEKLYNPFFKEVEFDLFKNEAGSNSFVLTPQKWIEKTGAVGIVSTSGRYGGTFAHKDIAFEFASWISAEFKLYLIKEFERLKTKEYEGKNIEWNAKRMLSKINYRIHTDAIHKNIIIPNAVTNKDSGVIYASEADVLNIALFGMTAETWKLKNKDKEGNMRDYADVYQLVCLSNLESLNAEFIKMGLTQNERLLKLNQTAIDQMTSLLKNNSVKKLLP